MSRPKKGRGPRVTPKRTRNGGGDDVSPIVGEIREVLEIDHPLGVLTMASSFAELAADWERPRSILAARPDGDAPPLTWDLLIEMFSDVDAPEMTALLHALVLFAPPEWEPDLRGELRRRRHHQMPRFVRSLADVEVVSIWEQGHVLGDGENLVFGLRWRTGAELTVVVYVDHNLGTVVKDVFTGPGLPDEVVALFEEQSYAGTFQSEIDPAQARARIEAAIERWSMTWPPIVSDEWPLARPLLSWIVGQLPDDATLPEPEQYSEGDRDALIDAFLSSPAGIEIGDDPDVRSLLDPVVWFGADYGSRNPLRWSAVRIEMLLTDWYPRKVLAQSDYLAKLPAVLEAFVPFALLELGGREGLDPQLTDELIGEALDAIDRWVPEYLELIGADGGADDDGDDDGPSNTYELAKALLAEVGDQLDPEGRAQLEAFVALGPDASERDLLVLSLGGEEAAAQIHSDPWPLEHIDLSTLPGDLRERVAEIDAVLTSACAERLDDEILAIGRRVLVGVVDNDPVALRGRGASAGWAAAILAVICDRNDRLGQGPGRLLKKDIAAACGVRTVGNRQWSVLRSAGRDDHSFDPELLDSAQRRRLLEKLGPDDGS